MPGTQATTLRDHSGRTVYNAVRVSIGLSSDGLKRHPPDVWPDLLGVEYRTGSWAPSRTSLVNGTEIVAGPVLETPYDRLPKPNELFPYDWRLDCRHNAGLLLDRLERDLPKGGRWNLIGHSQGGLLIVIASTLAGSPERFARLVRRVALIGCPLAGTLRAAEAILVGRDDLGGEPERVAVARRMARRWPALYQMLPLWKAVVRPNGRAFGRDSQLTEVGGYPGSWTHGIDEGFLKRARETAELLRTPLSHFGPEVRTLVIQGERHETPVALVRTGDDYKVSDAYGRTSLNLGMTKGDGLVPSVETLEWAGKRVRERAVRLAGKVREHAHICDGAFVTKKVARFISALVVASALGCGAVGAQQHRVQLAGFSEGYALVGVDWAVPLGMDPCAPSSSVCQVSRWRGLAAAYVGLVTRSIPVSAYGHVGVERMFGRGLGVGLLGFGFAHPARAGLAGRLDIYDVGALKLGRAWSGDRGWLVGVEVALGFLRDLGR